MVSVCSITFCYTPARLKPVPLPLAGEPQIPLYDGDLNADLAIVSRNRLAEQITGGLSMTQKMPSPSWGIPAVRCKIGSLLAEKPGSTCDSCYARKGRYAFGNVQRKLEERYQGLFNPLWTPAMVFLINYYCDEYFRWFDSGDAQGENHFRNICTVARNTPDVTHWLPTREIETVRACKDEIPENLTVRVSAAMIDGKPPKWPTTSTVVTEGGTCPSREQNNSCGSCRDCWDKSVKKVAYKRH